MIKNKIKTEIGLVDFVKNQRTDFIGNKFTIGDFIIVFNTINDGDAKLIKVIKFTNCYIFGEEIITKEKIRTNYNRITYNCLKVSEEQIKKYINFKSFLKEI